MEKSKPDNIVFDEESNKYNASILPYASSVGAPSIKIEDNKSWKERGVSKVCLLYTSPSPRDGLLSRMPSSA